MFVVDVVGPVHVFFEFLCFYMLIWWYCCFIRIHHLVTALTRRHIATSWSSKLGALSLDWHLDGYWIRIFLSFCPRACAHVCDTYTQRWQELVLCNDLMGWLVWFFCDGDSRLFIYLFFNKWVLSIKESKVHPCTGTEALYRSYGS
jgi:hypothetical protein